MIYFSRIPGDCSYCMLQYVIQVAFCPGLKGTSVTFIQDVFNILQVCKNLPINNMSGNVKCDIPYGFKYFDHY